MPMRLLALLLVALAFACVVPSEHPVSSSAPAVSSWTTRVFPLRYAAATELASTLNDLYAGSAKAAERRGSEVGCALCPPGREPVPGAPVLPHVTADPRTNSLVVAVREKDAADLDRIAELVARLDVEVKATR